MTALATSPVPVVDRSRSRPRWSRRLLAVTVVAQPLLMALNALLHPPVDLTAAGILAGVEVGPQRWYIVHMVAALGALLAYPTAVGLRSLVQGRGERTARLGVAVAAVGGPLLALAFAVEARLLQVAAADLDATTALDVARSYTSSPEFWATGLGVMAVTVALVLVGLGLLNSPSVPRWQVILLLVGAFGTAAGAPGTPVGPVSFGLVAVGSAFLAPRIARTR